MASFYPSTIKAWHWNYAMFPLTPLYIWWVYQVNTRLHPQETALWINAMLINTGQLLSKQHIHKRKSLPFQYHCMAYACTAQLIDVCQLNSWIQSESHKSKQKFMMPSCTLVAYLDIPPIEVWHSVFQCTRFCWLQVQISNWISAFDLNFQLDFRISHLNSYYVVSLPDQYNTPVSCENRAPKF